MFAMETSLGCVKGILELNYKSTVVSPYTSPEGCVQKMAQKSSQTGATSTDGEWLTSFKVPLFLLDQCQAAAAALRTSGYGSLQHWGQGTTMNFENGHPPQGVWWNKFFICFKKLEVASLMRISFEEGTGFCINKKLWTMASGWGWV